MLQLHPDCYPETMARTSGTKRAAADGSEHVGQRVAKKFGGKVYDGTVKNYVAGHKLWGIKYDDGDAEEMDAKELTAAMALHARRLPAVAPPAKKAPRGPPKARAPPPAPPKPPAPAKKAPAPAKQAPPPAKAKSPAPAPAKKAAPAPAAKKAPAPPAKKAAAPPAAPAPAPPAKKATPAKKAAAPAKKSPAVKKAKAPAPAKKATPAKKAAPPAKKPTQLEQDRAQVGKRVAKDFGGDVYGGTVKKFAPKGRLWAITYDDGDKEEMNAKELAAALKLQEKEKK